MGAIARAAGVTRQLLYIRFDGRAELLLELSRQIDAEVRTADRQARVDNAPDARAALIEAVSLQGHIKPRIAGVAAAIDTMRSTDEDAAAAWKEREQARRVRCLAVMQRAADEGALAAPWTVEDAASMMWSATSQRAWTELVVDRGWTTPQWVTRTAALLERALLASP